MCAFKNKVSFCYSNALLQNKSARILGLYLYFSCISFVKNMKKYIYIAFYPAIQDLFNEKNTHKCVHRSDTCCSIIENYKRYQLDKFSSEKNKKPNSSNKR